MEVTRPLLLRLFYQVKWPITPNRSAGSVLPAKYLKAKATQACQAIFLLRKKRFQHGQYLYWTVRSQVLFSFATSNSFLACLGRNFVLKVHVSWPKQTIHQQFRPFQKSKQQDLKTCYSNINTLPPKLVKLFSYYAQKLKFHECSRAMKFQKKQCS